VEVVGEGTEFYLEAFFENLSKEEIGLVLLAMGVAPDHCFNLKLGGGKNRGLGSVCFEIEKIQLLSRDQAYVSFDLGPGSGLQTVDLEDWGKEAVEAYLEWLGRLNEQWPQQVLDTIQCFQRDPDAEG
jgi:CRISPR/Cas system CSM-associated protein Csm3 (group 7 of RAMP superfamily)